MCLESPLKVDFVPELKDIRIEAIDKEVTLESIHKFLRRITVPVSGQYPRPWMTRWKSPESARVFTVGCNPKNPFKTEEITQEELI